jgi:amino-acid N-acetyltransferase
MKISTITSEDLSAIIHLLSVGNLPSDDIGAHNQTFFWAWEDGELIGCIGVERYGQSGLLRSMVVAETFRGQNRATALYNHLVDYSIEQGMTHLYLLTQTAKGFFEKMGWDIISRDAVPDNVKSSAEFAHLCPASAVCMSFSLLAAQSQKLFDSGFNCAQSVFVPFALQHGLDRQSALKLSTGFGAGMVYRGETCGAMTGAMMALGLLTGRSESEDTQARDVTYRLINQLYERFTEKHGSIICNQLLQMSDVSAASWDKVRADGLFHRRCPHFVRDAAKITNEIRAKQLNLIGN